MKRYYAAAGALLLGTSALAWAGDTDKTVVQPVKVATAIETGVSLDKSTLATKSDTAIFAESKTELSSLDKDLAKLAVAETDHKIQTASTDSWTDTKVETAAFDDSKIETASLDDTKLDTAWSDSGKVQTASTAGDSKTSVLTTEETGMGGPLEEVDTASTSAVVQPSNANPEHDARGIPVISDVAFVPPGFNGTGSAVGGPDSGDDESYPACTTERTDNCIQLYEHGVRAALATGESQTAMGGPYEPIDVDSTELAMNGDGDIQVSKGEATDAETVAVPTDSVVATHSDYQGVGGPVEAQSGYPPCSPGPGDDRCIQLYERGVSGAGN